MKPLRVAFQSVFPPFRGGISTFGRFTFDTLKRVFGEEHVKGYNFSKLYPSLLFPGKTQYLESMEKESGTVNLVHAYNPFNWSGAAREILEFKPDVYLYAHWHPFFCPAQNKIIRTLKRARPEIITSGILHNIEPHESFPFHEKMIRRMLTQTDIPVVLSTQTELEINTLNLAKKTLTLFHPVYEQEFPVEKREDLRLRFGVSEDETVLLFFGLVREYKGLDVLIEALNGLNMRDLSIRLFIVGEFYINRENIMGAVIPENAAQITVVDEFVSDEEAARYLHMSDVMVLPYKTASQSGILSNALNFGLPVLCSNHPGLAEQVANGVTGYLTEPGNALELRNSILSILSPERRLNMAEATNTFKETLSWSKFGSDLQEAINKYRIGAF